MKKFFILLINFLVFNTLNAHILEDMDKGVALKKETTSSEFFIVKNNDFALSTSKFHLDKREKFTPRMTMDFSSKSSENFTYQVAYEGNFLILDMFVPKVYETDVLNLYMGIKYKF